MNIEQLRLAGRLAWSDPLLLMDYGRWYVSGRVKSPPLHTSSPSSTTTLTLSEAETYIARRVGPWTHGAALERVRAHGISMAHALPASMRLATSMEGDTNLAALVYALVRALRPPVVVETGVATGITSAYILAALSDNGIGMLHSIDLPPTALVMAQLVGAAIPNNLRKQWTYYWGSARRLLPSVLRRAHPVSLFIHDSDHSYDNMRWELEQAWRVLEPGGCLVADDVNLHTAFGDMATAVGAQPVYVKQTGRKSGAIGLLWKSE